VSEVGQPTSEEQLAKLRLSVLDAFLLAAERRAEVMDAVAEARDPDEARRSIAQLLGITENAADAVLEVRLRRFTQREVADIRAENQDLRGLLDRAPWPGPVFRNDP
jgi:DNA gyrase/topoisomerase IV subunit A